MKVSKQVVLKPYRRFNKNRPPKDGRYLVVLDSNPKLMMISEWKKQPNPIFGGTFEHPSWTLGTEAYEHRVTHYMPIPKFFATSKRTVYS